MNKRLFVEAILKYLLGIVIVGLLLFIPAGSFKYNNAWIFIGLLFLPMFIVGIILMFKNPSLLKRRLNAKEKEDDQKEVILSSGIMFIICFILAGINYRFSLLNIPKIIIVLSIILFLVSYLIYGLILKQNEYLLRTIEVEKNQKLVDTGFYGIVRHPMYASTITLFLSIPLILNSLPSFLITLIYPFIIVKRIKNEEKILLKELKGYNEYKKKVKYRLIPYVW